MNDIFYQIYKENSKIVFSFFYHNTFSVEISEDLTQETFLKAFKSLNKFKWECSIKNWLLIIAKGKFYDYIRHQKKQNNLIEFLSQDTHNTMYYMNEDELYIKELLAKLDIEERLLITLKYFNDLSYKDMAKILSTNEGQIKIKLYRTRKKLKSLISKEYKEDI